MNLSKSVFILLLIGYNNSMAKNTKLAIIPGHSLGPYKIGDTENFLIDQGFEKDNSHIPGYFLKDSLTVLTKNERVVQIWYKGKNSDLSYNNKMLPEQASIIAVQKIFRNCKDPLKGSGGLVMSCENQGIEITTSFEPSSKNKFEVSIKKMTK